MTARVDPLSGAAVSDRDEEKQVIVYAQKGSTVAITVEEKHYHYHEWLTPELLVEMALAVKVKKMEE